MKPITMYVDVDLAAAIRVGKRTYGMTIVEVPIEELSPEERAVLMSLHETNRKPAKFGEYHLDPYAPKGVESGRLKLPAVPDDSVESIRTVLRGLVEALAKLNRARHEQIETIVARVQQTSDDEIEWSDRDHRPTQSWLGTDDCAVITAACTDRRITERLSAINERRHAERIRREAEERTERERAKTEEQARKNAGLAALRTWAEGRGSERLKIMIELQAGEWAEIARREYMDAHAPVGYTYGSFGGSERRKPTLQELHELKRLRELVAASTGVLSDPTIDWVTEEERYDEATGETVPERRFAVVEVRVHAPTGDWEWYSREIEPATA